MSNNLHKADMLLESIEGLSRMKAICHIAHTKYREEYIVLKDETIYHQAVVWLHQADSINTIQAVIFDDRVILKIQPCTSVDDIFKMRHIQCVSAYAIGR